MAEGLIYRLASAYILCHLHQVPSESEARPTRAWADPTAPPGVRLANTVAPWCTFVPAGRAAIHLGGGRWWSWSLQSMVPFCPAALMRSSREEQVEHTFQLVCVTLSTHA